MIAQQYCTTDASCFRTGKTWRWWRRKRRRAEDRRREREEREFFFLEAQKAERRWWRRTDDGLEGSYWIVLFASHGTSLEILLKIFRNPFPRLKLSSLLLHRHHLLWSLHISLLYSSSCSILLVYGPCIHTRSYKYIIHIAAQQRRSCQTCTSCESWMKVVWEVLCLSFVCLCCCYWWKEGRRTEKAYSFRDHQTFQPTSFFNLSVLPFSLNCVSSPPTVVLYSSSPRIKLWALLLVGDP